MTKALFAVVLVGSLSCAAWVWADPAPPPPPRWGAETLTQQLAPRIRITGGWFAMGSDDTELARARGVCGTAAGSGCSPEALAAEQPAHRVYVRAFTIDRFEVSNAAHQRCVNAGRCQPPRYGDVEPAPELPVVQLTFGEARDYCHFAGGELPTEAQWEYAAHGTSARSFPWAAAWDAKLVAATAHDVTAHAAGKSFFGLFNMAGNVWELVLDRYRVYDKALPNVDPVVTGAAEGPSSERVLRGGSWKSAPSQLRTRARAAIREDESRDDVGLRCAYVAGR